MTLVTIYQVKQGMTREFGFMGLDELRELTKQPQDINMKPYEVVFGERDIEGAVFFYSKDKSHTGILDKLFHVCNPMSPQNGETLTKHFGYKGRAMSVSDIVQIDGSFYYCDKYGWEPIMVKNVPHWIYVGMGASGSYFSDIHPFEVIKVSPSGKTITIREMDWEIIEGTDFNGTAKYEYTSNPDREPKTVRYSKHKGWKTPCGMSVSFGTARRYYDPTF